MERRPRQPNAMGMKMASVSVWLVFLLGCSLIVSEVCAEGPSAACDHHAAVGGSFSLPLGQKLLPKDYLKWWFNNKQKVSKRLGKITVGKETDINADGFLQLTNLKKTDEGLYKYEIHNEEGKQKDSKEIRLCVLDPVKEPTINATCDGEKVTFTCKPKEPKDVSIKWLENEKEISGQTGPTLKKDKMTKGVKITCRVSNKASSKASKPVEYQCSTSGVLGFLSDEIFGIKIYVFVGGGAGIVVLLIIIVIFFCVKARRKRRLRFTEEAELRLEWTHTEQSDHQHHCLPPLPGNHPETRNQAQHHHHHPHQQQQGAGGHTGTRQSRSKQPRQQRPRAPEPNGQPQPSPRRVNQTPKQADTADDDEPPPLPQPRKKGPRA